jgi:hypothetical protein
MATLAGRAPAGIVTSMAPSDEAAMPPLGPTMVDVGTMGIPLIPTLGDDLTEAELQLAATIPRHMNAAVAERRRI